MFLDLTLHSSASAADLFGDKSQCVVRAERRAGAVEEDKMEEG